MKTLNLYVSKSVLVILGGSIGILTFGMVGGNLLQAINYLSRGVPLGEFLLFMIYIFPMVLGFTIPWGILVAVLLHFGRMSANNEITAMRACGISIFQIISPVIVMTFVLTAICLYLQAQAIPYYYGKAKVLLQDVVQTAPQALLVPGQANEIGNMVVYIKDRNDKNEVKDVQIFTFSNDKKSVEQDITAANGKITANKEKGLLKIILYNYNIIDYAQGNHVYGKEFSLTFDVARSINERPLVQDISYATFPELLGRISLYHTLGLDTTEAQVNLNLRMALGLSPIAFLLLGLPLAIRTSRKETSVGLFISVILSGIYFFFIIGCRGLSNSPGLHPQTLLWIPNIIYQAGGIYFLFRIAKK